MQNEVNANPKSINELNPKKQYKLALPRIKNRVVGKDFSRNVPFKKIVIEFENKINIKAKEEVDEISQDEKKLKVWYLFQLEIQSPYVVKNVGIKFQNMKAEIHQQNFECFLCDLPLRKLSYESRFCLFKSIAEGVKSISDELICHTNLSPSNICIMKADNGELTCKLNFFFQAAKLQNRKSRLDPSNQECDRYNSPQIRERREYGIESDVWSLGAIFNYLLYETLDNIWLSNNQINIQVPIGTPAWLFKLLKVMMHYKPNKRHTINTVMKILKISQKCVDLMGKYIPLGHETLRFNKKQTILESEM